MAPPAVQKGGLKLATGCCARSGGPSISTGPGIVLASAWLLAKLKGGGTALAWEILLPEGL